MGLAEKVKIPWPCRRQPSPEALRGEPKINKKTGLVLKALPDTFLCPGDPKQKTCRKGSQKVYQKELVLDPENCQALTFYSLWSTCGPKGLRRVSQGRFWMHFGWILDDCRSIFRQICKPLGKNAHALLWPRLNPKSPCGSVHP